VFLEAAEQWFAGTLSGKDAVAAMQGIFSDLAGCWNNR
jgi:myo-inositol catabolism protein IolC